MFSPNVVIFILSLLGVSLSVTTGIITFNQCPARTAMSASHHIPSHERQFTKKGQSTPHLGSQDSMKLAN